MSEQTLFDSHYFQHGCGIPYERNKHWLTFFDKIAKTIARDITPTTMIDAGCAKGFLVEALRNNSVQAWGIDISEYAINSVHESVKPYCQQGSVVEPFNQRYDLLISIEVLEHLQKEDSEKAVQNFCAHTDDILFSSSPYDYAEATHFNVQPPEYWSECFARHGFYRDVDFDASFITPWAVRYRKKTEPSHKIIRDYDRLFAKYKNENQDLRNQVIKAEAENRHLQTINKDIQYKLDQTLIQRLINIVSKK